MRQLTYVGGSSIEWWDVPDCVARVAPGHFHPEQVITRKIRFEDAHEAIGDPTIRVAFVRDGIE